ncbi:MAG: hypothetical protein AAFQ92_18135 [Bacteroidota bacterium]
MPIDYLKYPPNWKTEIRPRILERAGNCCEWCKVPNHAEVWRDARGGWHLEDDFVEAFSSYSNYELDEQYPGWDDPKRNRFIKIVLTIAHLDHDPENHDVQDDRLAALCQQCHLRYDAPEKARKRRVKKYAQSLFPI